MKIPVYVHAIWQSWEKKYAFQAWSMDMTKSNQGYIFVAQTEVEVDIPPEDVLNAGTVAAYRAEQNRIRAEAEQKVQYIEQTIRNMQSLEHKAEEA